MPPLLVLGCSGPGAADVMARASLIGLACLVVTVLLTAATVRAYLPLQGALRKVGAVVGFLLIPAHPTVWLGVTSGDCGYTLMWFAPVVTVLHGLAAGFLLLRRGR